MKYQTLRELYIVTQWKDDCVYRTRRDCYAWVTVDYVNTDKNFQICSLSTKDPHNNGRTMRTVTDDTPDIDKAELKKNYVSPRANTPY